MDLGSTLSGFMQLTLQLLMKYSEWSLHIAHKLPQLIFLLLHVFFRHALELCALQPALQLCQQLL